MSEQISRILDRLKQTSGSSCLSAINHGLEKESLRIDPNGHIALTPHPPGLGSALTHPQITTDFSEALMEFITPVMQKPDATIAHLSDIHTYIYSQLPREELLWTSSMPCVIGKDEDIPLAQYGSSNSGRLKTLYRKGLGFRYGRTMQTIAGIHFNFSLPEAFWPLYHGLLGSTQSLTEFQTDQYFGLIRNFRRYSWLLVYLFGASPALCRSFVRNRPNHGLEHYDDDGTLYLPYATSLRMGDLGYTSEAQAGLYISYNSLQQYADGLTKAIKTPYPPYANFATADGSPAQINSNVLQIENEFYSTIRPKRVTPPGKRPVHMLRAEGVQYIEVRCIDLNPFMAVGIDSETMHFLNAFLLYCLLRDSPPSEREEYHEIDANFKAVVKQGRDPALQLTRKRKGGTIPLKDWAGKILRDVEEIAKLLDSINGTDDSVKATAAQNAKVADSALTPSAKVLQRMREGKTGYFRFAMNQSLANSDYFRSLQLTPQARDGFVQMGEQSRHEQTELEQSDTVDFATYVHQLNAS
ncbi:MAG TPA: glutamate--cysteine ligase [Pseudomonadales bacterium]